MRHTPEEVIDYHRAKAEVEKALASGKISVQESETVFGWLKAQFWNNDQRMIMDPATEDEYVRLSELIWPMFEEEVKQDGEK